MKPKVFLGMLLGLLLAVLLVSGNAMALSFGTNITVFDGDWRDQNWHQKGEDSEVEPGCLHGQQWDLEGFFLDGTTLTMVGGYNFKKGEDDPFRPGNHYDSGDIFIDVGGAPMANTFDYDYVFDLNFGTEKYAVYELTTDTVLNNVYFNDYNGASNPWTWERGGNPIGTGDITYYDAGLVGDSDVGFLGGTHYAASVDLGFLALARGTKFTAHNTMECGNDNLMGQGVAPVPEPATMLLLGTGLVAFAGLGRKKLFSKD